MSYGNKHSLRPFDLSQRIFQLEKDICCVDDQVFNQIKSFYTGPGIEYFAYDGVNFSFESIATGQYPVVSTFADLPAPGSVSPPNNIYIVENASGVPFINRKQPGIYYSNGVAWKWLGEAETLFVDNVFRIIDDVSSAKYVMFEVGGLTTGRVKIFQDTDGTIAELTDLPTLLSQLVNDVGFVTGAHTHDATDIADGSVSNTEFQYINSLTSNVQTQINTLESDAVAMAVAL